MKNNYFSILFLLPIVYIIFTLLFISGISGQIISQSITTINDYVQASDNARTLGGSLLTFSEIIRQKTFGNQVQQCPCVRPPGVNRCISYDSRFQGASIEEAILTFVDTSMDPRIYDNRIGGPIGSRSLLCSSEECRQCAAILAVRLRQIGLLQRSPTFSFPLPDFNQIQPQLCPRLRLSRTIPNLQPPAVLPSFVTQMVQAGLARIPARDTTPRTAFGVAVAAAIRQARSIRGRPFFDIIARIRNQRLQNTGNGNRRNQQNQGNNNNNGNGGSNGNRRNQGNNNGNGVGGGSRGISRPQQPQQQQNPRSQFPSPPFNQRPPTQQPNTPNTFPNRVFPLPQQPRPPLQQPNPPQTFPVIPRPQQPPFQQIPIQLPQPQQPQQPPQQPIFQPPIVQQPGGGGGQQQPPFQPPIIQNPIFQQPGGGGQQQQPIFQQPVQVPVFQQPNFPQNPQFPNGPQSPDGILSPQGPFASIQQPLGSAFSSLAQQGALQGFQHAVSAIPGLSGGNPLGGGGGAGQGGGGGNGGGIGFGGGGGGGGSPGGQFGNPGPGPGFPFGKRKKRAADDGILGDRFVISCVERGDTENEASDYLNLCTACWTWRQLPPDYFPRLINELVCNENDFCLSGWGSCQQRYRNVDVLRRGPNGAWQPTSISVATCCDCKVKAGTEVHALVIGKNKV